MTSDIRVDWRTNFVMISIIFDFAKLDLLLYLQTRTIIRGTKKVVYQFFLWLTYTETSEENENGT